MVDRRRRAVLSFVGASGEEVARQGAANLCRGPGAVTGCVCVQSDQSIRTDTNARLPAAAKVSLHGGGRNLRLAASKSARSASWFPGLSLPCSPMALCAAASGIPFHRHAEALDHRRGYAGNSLLVVDRRCSGESSASGEDQDANHRMAGRNFLWNLYVSHGRGVYDVVVFQGNELVARKPGGVRG